jgi:DNA-binding phage protein
MAKKPTDKAIMTALTKRVQAITEGTARPARAALKIDAALRQAIRKSGLTHYALSKAAGVQASQLDRFMMPADDPRRRDLRLETAAAIAAVLGLRLTAD